MNAGLKAENERNKQQNRRLFEEMTSIEDERMSRSSFNQRSLGLGDSITSMNPAANHSYTAGGGGRGGGGLPMLVSTAAKTTRPQQRASTFGEL